MKTIKTEKYKGHTFKYVMPETEDEKIDVEKLEEELKEEDKNSNINKWKFVKNIKTSKAVEISNTSDSI